MRGPTIATIVKRNRGAIVKAPTLRFIAGAAILLAPAFHPSHLAAQRAAAARVAPHAPAAAARVPPAAAVVAGPQGTAAIAVPRSTVVVGGGYPYHGGYHYGYGYPGYGSFYVGYPWYGGGFAFSVGVGFGYPYAPYYAYPYAAPYPAYGYVGYPAGPVYYDGSAALHLQVTPRNTEVYVDGYYAGLVDDFDGTFQRLNVQPGQHDVELYLPGHRALERKVYLQPGKTTNFKYAMEPLAPGEPEPLKPSPGPDPSITPSSPSAPPSSSPQRPSGSARRSSPMPPTRDYPRDTSVDSGITLYKGNPDARLDTHSTGSLSLQIQPGPATVTIDGERWEGSPDGDRLVVQLSPGSHVLEVAKDGYRRYTTEVMVRGGQTSTLNVALTKN
jgi:hypothetical protein